MMMKNIVFRVDASANIGTGHLVRCLTLAKKIKNQLPNSRICFAMNLADFSTAASYYFANVDVLLVPLKVEHQRGEPICESLVENWRDDFEETKNQLASVSMTDIDLVIVDHYGLDARWQKSIKNYYNTPIMVIDDLANRKHHCDVLLDTNLWPDMTNRYNQFVDVNTKMLLGSSYCLLREGFRQVELNKKQKKILVLFGGTDLTGECLKCLNALKRLQNQDMSAFCKLDVHVITGKLNKNLTEINQHHLRKNNKYVTVYDYVDDIWKLMSECEYAVGAGGTTVWERMCLGVQSFVVSVADNQLEASCYLDEKELIHHLGFWTEVSEDIYIKTFKKIADATEPLICLPSTLHETVDGKGCGRVVDEINRLLDK